MGTAHCALHRKAKSINTRIAQKLCNSEGKLQVGRVHSLLSGGGKFQELTAAELHRGHLQQHNEKEAPHQGDTILGAALSRALREGTANR